nr:hypothetical protein [Methylobacterium sp. L1A1]
MAGQDSAGRWTAERVGETLVEAFRALPHMPVYAPRHAPQLEPVLPGHDPGPLDVLALSERVLGRSSLERRLVLIWARSIATGGDVGGSLRVWCRAHGMNRSTFDRRRVRACAQIAAEMNRTGEGALEARESLRVEAPALAARVEML